MSPRPQTAETVKPGRTLGHFLLRRVRATRHVSGSGQSQTGGGISRLIVDTSRRLVSTRHGEGRTRPSEKESMSHSSTVRRGPKPDAKRDAFAGQQSDEADRRDGRRCPRSESEPERAERPPNRHLQASATRRNKWRAGFNEGPPLVSKRPVRARGESHLRVRRSSQGRMPRRPRPATALAMKRAGVCTVGSVRVVAGRHRWRGANGHLLHHSCPGALERP